MSINIDKIDLLVITGSIVESPLFLVCDSKENTYYCSEDEWNEEMNKVKEDYIEVKSFLEKIKIPYISVIGDKDIRSIFMNVFGNTSGSVINSDNIQVYIYIIY